jgi:hypothetical protein
MPGKLTADQAIGLAKTLSRGQATASRSCAGLAAARELRNAPGQAVLAT